MQESISSKQKRKYYNFIKHQQLLIPVTYGGRNYDKQLNVITMCPIPNILLARILTVIRKQADTIISETNKE